MAKWDKEKFIEHLRESCSREVAKIGIQIIEFTEQYADDYSWGRGTEHGTLTFRANSDLGLLPLFHFTSDGKINILINFLRSKELPKKVLRDLVVKLEANFLREYDPEMYPTDVFEPVEDLFNTQGQVERFLKAIEGCAYRLKQ
ncbi:MAG: hypothetical protein D6762_02600 [Candidatus Neomarinimicrobiota bacterium]|nr:MAG: hypothetical protein D6762_02600 [Candidatus Neomarinimicrobiota bacterium]